MTHYPESLMTDIGWHIGGPIYNTSSDFESAVYAYHRALQFERFWNPALIALNAKEIRIEVARYELRPLEFQSNNHRFFSEGELLFKIHNALAEVCYWSDHLFFEGLNISQSQDRGKPPLYRLLLGS